MWVPGSASPWPRRWRQPRRRLGEPECRSTHHHRQDLNLKCQPLLNLVPVGRCLPEAVTVTFRLACAWGDPTVPEMSRRQRRPDSDASPASPQRRSVCAFWVATGQSGVSSYRCSSAPKISIQSVVRHPPTAAQLVPRFCYDSVRLFRRSGERPHSPRFAEISGRLPRIIRFGLPNQGRIIFNFGGAGFQGTHAHAAMSGGVPTKSAKSRQYGVVLSPQLAKEIYKSKLEAHSSRRFERGLKGQSVPVAKKYNVSAKTIRDIWNRRTWTAVTCEYWDDEDLQDRISQGNADGGDSVFTSMQSDRVNKMPATPNLEYNSQEYFKTRLPMHTEPDFLFLSVIQDSAFLPWSMQASNPATQVGAESLDPFHADWPHWD